MSVIIVEPLSSGIALVEAASRMGQETLVFTANHGERQVSETCREWATSITEVDTYDAPAVLQAARKVHRAGQLEAIVPGFEYCVDVVATVASSLGLPHLSMSAATLARNKFACRERLKAAGLKVPRYALIRDQSEVQRAAHQVGFSAVIKPADGGGSLMVRRVDSLDELHSAVGDFEVGVTDVDHYVGPPFLLEEFLEGHEFSVEGYVDHGRPHVAAVTEKQVAGSPYFIEMGHVVEAPLGDEERMVLVTYIEQVVLAVGLGLGVFHAEVRITDRGPVLIEINCRLGGGRIPRLVELTKGLSLAATMLRSYIGLECPARAEPLNSRHGIAGVRFLTSQGIGVFGTATGLDEVRSMPGCEEVEIYFRTGDTVPLLTDFRGRIGHLLFTAEDRPTLDRSLQHAENLIQLTTLNANLEQQRNFV